MAVDTAVKADPEPARPPSPRRLDRRTVLICLVVALVVAAVTGGIVAAVTDHAQAQTGEPALSQAKVVPDDVSFTRFDGTKGTLGDYAGQKLVVNFFSSTCVPCRTEMPAMEQVQKQAGDQITVIGIDVEDQTKAAEALVKATGVHYDIGQDPTGELWEQSGGTVLPYTIFVAADGTIMERHSGAMTAAEIRKKISNNLLAGG